MNALTRIVSLSATAAISLWAITTSELYLLRAAIHATTTPTRTVESDIFILAAIILLGPAIEESLFRFLMIRIFLKRFSAAISIPVSTFAFTLWHTQHLSLDVASIAAMITIATSGLVFGLIYVKAGTLLSPIAAHGAYNAIVTFVPTKMFYEVERLPMPVFLGLSLSIFAFGAWSLLLAFNALATPPLVPNAQAA